MIRTAYSPAPDQGVVQGARTPESTPVSAIAAAFAPAED